MARVPLGVKNNNPLNMRPDGRSQWQGLAVPPTMEVRGQGDYLVFSEGLYGWRAAAVDLLGKQKRGGQMSIRRIVTIWAPAEDNNHPASYASSVAAYTGIDADEPVDLRDVPTLKSILLGMARVELGVDPLRYFDHGTVDRAIVMALAAVPDIKPLRKSRTIAGSAMSAIGTAGTAAPTPDVVAVAGDAVKEASFGIQSIMYYVDQFRWVFILLVVIGIGLTVWARIDDSRKGVR